MWAAGALLVVAACAAPRTPGEVVLSEFDIATGLVGAGPTTLEVVNAGQFAHTLVVSDADGRVVTTTDILPPGTSTDLSLHLGPGTYQFTCRIVVETGDGRIVDHYAEGMRADVTVSTSA